MPDLVGDLGDPVKDAAAFAPVINANVDKIVAVLEQLGTQLNGQLDFSQYTVTITFTKKGA